MFSNYKVVNNVLYLYVDFSCEIGNIFDKNSNNHLVYEIKKYIKDKKIKFNGIKVVLLLSGLMLGTVYLNKPKQENYEVYKDNKYVYNIVDNSVPNMEKKEVNELESNIDEVNINNKSTSNKKELINNKSSIKTSNTTNNIVDINKNIVTEKEHMVTLKRTNGEVINLSITDYLIGVVAAEMPASFDIEALKAQSVVARTYTYKLIEYGRDLTDDVSTQVYKSNAELKNIWGANYNKYYEKVSSAVRSTGNEVIKYNGTLIDAVYHSTSNGYTEDSINVWGNSYPYLKTVTSPWDTSTTSFLRSTDISYDIISKKLNTNVTPTSSIVIDSRNESGRVSKIIIDNNSYTGVELRNLLGLRSADFDIDMKDNVITFTTRGYGHGVGMSQYGADKMAKAGYSYKQILNYYYTNVIVE